MKDLDYGKGYQYAHDTEEKLTDMQCLPDSLADRTYTNLLNRVMKKNIKNGSERYATGKKNTDKTSDQSAFPCSRSHFIPLAVLISTSVK